jgi:hypothetical protein
MLDSSRSDVIESDSGSPDCPSGPFRILEIDRADVYPAKHAQHIGIQACAEQESTNVTIAFHQFRMELAALPNTQPLFR